MYHNPLRGRKRNFLTQNGPKKGASPEIRDSNISNGPHNGGRSREYLTLYIELLNIISALAQTTQTLEALQACKDLLAQRADIKELIDFAKNLMKLTGKEEFIETLSHLKREAQKLIDRQAK
jgi:hypothetical protein